MFLKKYLAVPAVSVLLFGCQKDQTPQAAGYTDYTIKMASGWKFIPGDDSLAAEKNYNGTAPDTIAVGKNWIAAGFTDVRGFAWYRNVFTVPATVQQNPYHKYGKGLLLNLGSIGDADETFFNGVKIGSTGSISPFEAAMRTPREYFVPDSLINYGGFNTLAVRVYAESERAGIYAQVPTLSSDLAHRYITQEWKFVNSASGIYAAGDTVKISYSVTPNAGQHSLPVFSSYNLSVQEEGIENTVLNQIKISPKADATGTQSGVFTFTAGVPGFYRVNITAFSASGDTLLYRQFRLGVSPQSIQPTANEPKDFHDFWKNTKKELAGIEPQYQVQKVDSLCTDTRNTYLVTMQSLGNISVKGWYTTPKKPGTYPAVLELPWFTGGLPARHDSSDISFFTLHTRGHGMSREQVNPGFPGYLTNGIDHQSSYIYRGAIMDARRALDFIFSRPETDTARVAVMGISQGGGLTIAATALDNRVAYACFTVPFLSRWDIGLKIAQWPRNEFEEYVAARPGTSMADLLNVLCYHDVSNLAQWIKCPVYMAVGLQDPTCPPQINFAAYNRIKGQKEVEVYPYGGHDAGGNAPMIAKIKSIFSVK